jgi:hypothetical protein
MESLDKKKKIIISLALLLVLLISLILFLKPPEVPEGRFLDFKNRQNLLPNGDFEDTTTDGLGLFHPSSWVVELGTGQFSHVKDSTDIYHGERSIMLGNSYNEDRWWERVRITSSKINIADMHKKSFILTGYSKSVDVSNGRIMARMKTFPSSGSHLTDDIFYIGNSTNWTQFNFILETIPENAVSVEVSFLLDNSPGTVYIDYVGLYELSEEDYKIASNLDKYVAPNLVGESIGQQDHLISNTTQVKEINGAWWLVSATGMPFWATGVSSISYDQTENPTLWANVGSPNSTERGELINQTKVRAKSELKFNTNVKTTVGSDTENLILWINFGSEAGGNPSWILKDKDGNPLGENGSHQFPDPFDPKWEQYAREQANNVIKNTFVGKKNILGYWTDNEIYHDYLHNYIWSNSCAHVFVEWLQGNYNFEGYEQPPHGKYNSIEELNQAWSASGWHEYTYPTFADIITSTTKPRIHHFNDTRVMEDLYAFERVVYKKYISMVKEAIRSREMVLNNTYEYPARLIISNRFAYEGPSFSSDGLKRVFDLFSTFDLIAINAYPRYNRDRTYYSKEFLEDMKSTFYDTTNRPIIISEFGVAGEDSGIDVARWRPMTVKNQTLRGLSYKNLISTMFSMPWVVGQMVFKWENGYYTADGKPDPRNCGIVNDNNEFYEAYAKAIKETNELVNTKQRLGSFSIESIKWKELNFRIER